MNKLTIKDRGQIIAHIFRSKLSAEGVNFLTPPDYTLQLGLIEHPAGHIVKDHLHRQDIKYKVNTTQEFLYIEKGQIEISFYNNEWKLLKRVKLRKGDFVLLISGGHGLKVLKKSRIIEIKQGPYPGDRKAKILRNDD